ncbi:MAG: hypothetical protein LBO62_02720, partial [Endomicrobium sp.]|nr:hypothetical protein [Endomicrobium sp.]
KFNFIEIALPSALLYCLHYALFYPLLYLRHNFVIYTIIFALSMSLLPFFTFFIFGCFDKKPFMENLKTAFICCKTAYFTFWVLFIFSFLIYAVSFIAIITTIFTLPFSVILFINLYCELKNYNVRKNQKSTLADSIS